MMNAGDKKRQHAKAGRRLSTSSTSSFSFSSSSSLLLLGGEEEQLSNDLRGIQKKRPKLNHFVQGMVHREPILRGQQKVKERSVVKNPHSKRKCSSSSGSHHPSYSSHRPSGSSIYKTSHRHQHRSHRSGSSRSSSSSSSNNSSRSNSVQETPMRKNSMFTIGGGRSGRSVVQETPMKLTGRKLSLDDA
jgi:hypothetical protein